MGGNFFAILYGYLTLTHNNLAGYRTLGSCVKDQAPLCLSSHRTGVPFPHTDQWRKQQAGSQSFAGAISSWLIVPQFPGSILNQPHLHTSQFKPTGNGKPKASDFL